jgi:hypothetical protein
MMSSSPLVGCQSVMGLRRRSNSLELESFHLRNIVQRIAIPPTEAAIAMRAVNVLVLVFEDADCTWATAVSDGAAEDTDSVLVIVAAILLIVEVTRRGVKCEVEDVLEADVEVDDEVFVAVEDVVGEDVVELLLEEAVVVAMAVEVVSAEVKDKVIRGEGSDAVD